MGTRRGPLGRAPRSAAAATALAGAVCLGACSGAEDLRVAPTGPATMSARTVTAPTPTAPPPAEACAEGPDRTVRLLPDVVVPAVEVAGVPSTAPDGTGPVPGFTIPAQLVDGGCVVEYAAPGGCIGAVEITPVRIPGTTVPETVVPATRLPGGRVVPERRFPAVTVPATTIDGARAEQVCREEVDGELPTVSRLGVVRQGGSRNGTARPGGTRPAVCEGAVCAREVVVDGVRIEPVRVDDVDVDPVRLTRERVAGPVDVVTGGDRRSYVAPGDVLFATDEDTLRPASREALRTIADLVRPTTGAVTVEGHTDDRSDEAYNLALSRRRAQAVAKWLSTVGGIPAERISVVARGEGSPVVPNDSESHRQANRRVVVSVPTS